MKKVSVIIPVYNSEVYIKECIQSVVRQSYANWEIIVVDDGSVDKSTSVCRKLCHSDNRIRLFCQGHRGVSAARNRGIAESTGDFLLFLDSDDVIHPLLLERFVYLAQKYHAELVMCQCRKVDSCRMKSGLDKMDRDTGGLRGKVGKGTEIADWFHLKYARQMSGIGGKMIRKDAVGELRFDERLGNGEDTLFLYHLTCRRICAVYIDCEWYYYRMHPGNTINSFHVKSNSKYFACSRRIRNSEYQKGNIGYALTWERMLLLQIEGSLMEAKKEKDQNRYRHLKEVAFREIKFPLFWKLEAFHRFMFWSCLFFHPLYFLLRRVWLKLWR